MANITDASISNLSTSVDFMLTQRAALNAKSTEFKAALIALVARAAELDQDIKDLHDAVSQVDVRADAVQAQVVVAPPPPPPATQQQVIVHQAGGIQDVPAGRRSTMRLRFTLGALVRFNCKPFVHLYQNGVKVADVTNHSARMPMGAAAPGSRVEFDWVGQIPASLQAGFYDVGMGFYTDNASYTLIPNSYEGAPGLARTPEGNEQYYVGGIQVGAYVAPADLTDVSVFPNGNYVLPIARTF